MAVYAERKLSAFMQDRLGPMEVGSYGTLQAFADILKLLQKEFIIPAAADRVLFFTAPVLIYIAVYLGFAALPWAPGLIPSSLNLGVFYIFAIISVETVGILMAGWGSNNKYALLGSMRSVAQIISYEIPAGIAVISAVMISQSLNLQEVTLSQGILSTGAVNFLGLIDVKKFVNEEKMNNIITVSKTLDTTLFGPIKQSLGDEYSYSEIRFAMAYHQNSKK